MTITFNGGTHDVEIFKKGERFNRDNLPYFFNSITSVEATLSQGEYTMIKVMLEPSWEDGIRILASGLLGIGYSDLATVPKPASTAQAGASSTQTATAQTTASQTAQPAAATQEGDTAKADMGNTTAPFIAVKFLYPGQLDNDGSPAETPWFTGPVFSPHIEISNTTISITLVAQATIAFLRFVQGVTVANKVSVLSLIETLAKPLNVQVTFDKGDTETKAKLESTMVSGIYNESKMQTIRNLLYRYDCYWATPSGDSPTPKSELRIKSRKRITEEPPVFTFVMFRQISVAKNIIPIFDLSLEQGTVLFLSQGAFGSFQRGVLEGSKKVQQVAVNPSAYDGKAMTGSGTTGGTLPKGEAVAGGSTGITDDSDPELTGSSTPVQMRGKAGTTNSNVKDIEAAVKRASFNGVGYRLTVPGHPRYKVMASAQVIVGDFIPGLSAVGHTSSVTHTSDGNGWTSSIVFRQTAGMIDKAAASNFSNQEIKQVGSTTPGTQVTSTPIPG